MSEPVSQNETSAAMTDEQLLAALEAACPHGGWGAYRVCLPFNARLRDTLMSALRRYA